MLAFIRYTTLRFAILIGVGVVCYLLGLRELPLLIIAFVVSGALSLFVLDRQRDALGASVGGLFAHINRRIEANSRSEDFDDDAPTDADGAAT